MPHERTLPEGEDRPARAAARHPRQPRPDLGPLARRPGSRRCCIRPTPSPLATAVDEDGVPPLAVAIDRPRRGSTAIADAVAPTPRRARRRPPPLRDRQQLPRASGARRGDRRPRRRRDHDPGRRARPRPALRAAPSTACSPASTASTCAPRSAARSTSTPPAPNVPEGVAALEAAMRDERRPRPRRPRRARAARARPPSSSSRLTRAPASSSATSTSARFDAGVLPAVPATSTLTYRNDARDRRRHGRQGRRRRRGAAAPGHRRARSAPRPHADLRMPEKTTFFAPKPRTGMVFRSLDLTELGGRSVDVPGGAGADAAWRGRRGPDAPTRVDELALHLGLVGRALRRPEHADRRGHRRRRRQARQRERQRRVGAGLVVHEERVLADVGDARRSRHSPYSLSTTPRSLSSPKRIGSPCCSSMSMSARAVLGRDALERAVVEDVAVLVDLDERAPWCSWARRNTSMHVLAVHVVGAGHERGLGAERDRDRVERVSSEPNGDDLVTLPDLARRRVLALGEPVDLVVEHAGSSGSRCGAARGSGGCHRSRACRRRRR